MPSSPQIIAEATSFSGPLPPPDLLEAYERTQPGLSDRIVRMAESEQTHRQRLENREHQSQVTLRIIGLLGGIVLAVLGILAGGYLVLHDKALAGFTLFVGALGGLIATAIYKHRQEAAKAP
jgi:uncharacterized membrane protein